MDALGRALFNWEHAQIRMTPDRRPHKHCITSKLVEWKKVRWRTPLNRIRTSSSLLILALLWQLVFTCFGAEAVAAPPNPSRLTASEQHNTHQLSMVAGKLPVLFEGKRPERIAKGNPQPQSFTGIRSGFWCSSTPPAQSPYQFNTLPLPAQRGYWLLYRAMLL